MDEAETGVSSSLRGISSDLTRLQHDINQALRLLNGVETKLNQMTAEENSDSEDQEERRKTQQLEKMIKEKCLDQRMKATQVPIFPSCICSPIYQVTRELSEQMIEKKLEDLQDRLNALLRYFLPFLVVTHKDFRVQKHSIHGITAILSMRSFRLFTLLLLVPLGLFFIGYHFLQEKPIRRLSWQAMNQPQDIIHNRIFRTFIFCLFPIMPIFILYHFWKK